MDPKPVPQRASASSARQSGGANDKEQAASGHDTIQQASGSVDRGNAGFHGSRNDYDAVPLRTHHGQSHSDARASHYSLSGRGQLYYPPERGDSDIYEDDSGGYYGEGDKSEQDMPERQRFTSSQSGNNHDQAWSTLRNDIIHLLRNVSIQQVC